MSTQLPPHNVQAVVAGAVHKTLRDVAYSREMTLKDLIREILTDYAVKVESKSHNQAA